MGWDRKDAIRSEYCAIDLLITLTALAFVLLDGSNGELSVVESHITMAEDRAGEASSICGEGCELGREALRCAYGGS